MTRRYLLSTLSLLLCAAASAEPLARGERNYAMSEMHAGRKLFLDSIENVSEAQWRFKPAPERWSIAEVAEHIAASEEGLADLVQKKIMAMPADSHRAKNKDKDTQIVTMLQDRSQKAQAPEELKPTNRWKSKAELITFFKQKRDANIAYMDKTDDDLRAHYMQGPASMELDAYQWMLLLAGHSMRHTLQINEVKASPNYPKK